MNSKIVKIFLSLSIFFSTSLFSSTITIAVASNVSYAINSLTKEFNTIYPDTKVRVILGSSGKLTAQIKHGAPYHVFMSANMNYPQALYDEDLGISKPVVYAQGGLACLSGKKRNFTECMQLALSSNIDKIAVANPRTAPYGIATAEALKNAAIYGKIEKKFVYGESISQTVSYAVTAADMGFIAKSSLYSPHMAQYKKGENWIDVDSKLYTSISQGMILLKDAKENREAKAFYDFILSDKAKKILRDFGYLAP